MVEGITHRNRFEVLSEGECEDISESQKDYNSNPSASMDKEIETSCQKESVVWSSGFKDGKETTFLVRYGPSPFRFHNMWISYEDFLNVVTSSWRESIVSNSGLSKLAKILKRLKIALRTWNKKKFGQVDVVIRELEERLEVLEGSLQSNYNEDDKADLLATKAELEVWLKQEDMRLAQQAKKKWWVEGDQNSRFFHAIIAQRRSNYSVREMRLPDGGFFYSPRRVHEEAVKYFESFLMQENLVELPDLKQLFPQGISNDNAQKLKLEPMEREVKLALSSIGSDSSSWLNGFGSAFNLACWNIVKMDVMEAVKEVFRG
ncbi:uncharacterized protein LOC121268148 [Juglans microcarpa x Juglans regia]|uniref:uncharacterized protein LOC121268148 n=1 Tax=Juglans microcarpa x Juglans regia TaxID=2249226 RepID=UPI001B7F69EC|nr:uncharacterized protein LOC121268148 [Juglans microcarpa x Juglans regia]